MKTTSLSDIRQELENLSAKEITALCLRLARYKKENKELLQYLLFNAHDTEAYTEQVKEMIDALFEDVNRANLHLAKKTLRKILKQTNKYIRYTGSKQTEAALLIISAQV
jgi:hypothetical protein